MKTGEGNGNPLQYSCLGNPMDRGTCPWISKESDTTERLHFHFQEINKCIYIAKKKKEHED